MNKKIDLDELLTPIINQTAKVVPMHVQAKGLHLLRKATDVLIPDFILSKPPVFKEEPLPDVNTLAIEDIDVSNPFLFRQGKWLSYFKRLREEAPVHYQANSPFGPFWSITRYDDVVFVDRRHDLFSAEPAIILGETPRGLPGRMFIAMDPPKHDEQRKAVQSVVAPKNLKEMENVIRDHVCDILDNIPTDQPFDMVSAISKELTSRMLATILDFPFEKRHKLAEWSDTITASPETTGGTTTREEIFEAAVEFAREFSTLWWDKKARKDAGEEMGFDLISLMLGNEDTKDLISRPMEFMGNLTLLVVGGNDTTRNSITGGVLALNQNPEEFKKLKANPSLIPNMVSEIIRWQTPLAYMRRIAKEDVVLNGQTIKKGDKVIMWYASANRDESKIENADKFLVDRKGARNHLSFGFGIHRCMGNRLAEMQLRILWEEILARFDDIKVIEGPGYVQSNFVKGYTDMTVQFVPKKAPKKTTAKQKIVKKEAAKAADA